MLRMIWSTGCSLSQLYGLVNTLLYAALIYQRQMINLQHMTRLQGPQVSNLIATRNRTTDIVSSRFTIAFSVEVSFLCSLARVYEGDWDFTSCGRAFCRTAKSRQNDEVIVTRNWWLLEAMADVLC